MNKWLNTSRIAGELSRFHTRGLIKNQNVATHSFNSVFIALEIAQSVTDISIERIMKYCLLHDLSEIYVSDVSGEVKQDHPELKKLLDSIEKEWVRENIPEYLQPAFLLNYEEAQICKLSDLFDALITSLTDLRLNNYTLKPAVKNLYQTIQQKLEEVSNPMIASNAEEILVGIEKEFEKELLMGMESGKVGFLRN